MSSPTLNAPENITVAGDEIWFECVKCRCVFHEKPKKCPACKGVSTEFEEVSSTETVEEFNARIAEQTTQNKNGFQPIET